MKTLRILIAILLFVPLTFQSCEDDIKDLDDPRDGIVDKTWRVTDNTPFGANAYDVSITKHATDKTKVLFSNFHGLKTTEKLEATFSVSGAQKVITIAKQTLDNTYTFEGSGSVGDDGETMTLNYKITEDGESPVEVVAEYGKPVVKKKNRVIALK